MNIRNQFVRDTVSSAHIVIPHVNSSENGADVFTMTLDIVKYEKLRGMICVHPIQ